VADFATTDDLAEGWRALTSTEEALAEVLLARASIWLRAWFPDLDDRVTAGTLDAAVPRMVAASMVKRAMLNADTEGVKQSALTQAMGSIQATESRTYSNPDGALYVTEAEAALLSGTAERTVTSGAVSMTCEGM
jgi:hypothetical protein